MQPALTDAWILVNLLSRSFADLASIRHSLVASAHVLMSHIYIAHGRDEQAAEIRRIMKNEKLHKLHGKSCIEVDGVLHTFRVGDTSHPEMKQIVAVNEELNTIKLSFSSIF